MYVVGENGLFGTKIELKSFIEHLSNTNGADIDVRDKFGNNAIILATLTGRLDVVSAILKFKPNVNTHDIKGNTPLRYAQRWPKMAELLLEYGADVNRRTILVLSRVLVRRGPTPLQLAVEDCNSELVSVLLEYGANLVFQDFGRQTPFPFAFKKRRYYIFRLLLASIELRAAGLVVNQKNLRAPEVPRWSPETYGDLTWYCSYFKNRCLEEVAQLRMHKLGATMSLHDVLIDGHAHYVSNEALVKALDSVDFDNFPLYGKLLVRKMMKDDETATLLKRAEDLLSDILRRGKLALPNEIVVKILKHLTDGELRCLLGEGLKPKWNNRRREANHADFVQEVINSLMIGQMHSKPNGRFLRASEWLDDTDDIY